MKKFALAFSFLFMSLVSLSQSDTLFLQKNKKIACKISEINEQEIKYKLASALDGPIYTVNKTSVTKYCLSNGFCELLVPDELSLENEHKEILGNRQVIKIHPFSFAGNHLSFAYERVIKVGMNLDVELGYINSGINKASGIFGSMGADNVNGFYLKPGVKFFLGQDFSVKGLKYAHPLKGRYIKLDLVVANIAYNKVAQRVFYGPNNPIAVNYTDVRTTALGGFVNYGRQFILGNILTLDYYVGVGFTGGTFNSKATITNSQYSNYYQISESNYTSNYYSFLRSPQNGLSATAGFRIGYIIPSSKKNQKAK